MSQLEINSGALIMAFVFIARYIDVCMPQVVLSLAIITIKYKL